MVRASGGFRGRVLLAAGALSVFIAAGIALQSAKGEVPRLEDPAERLVLRLHDLPPGFYPIRGFEGIGGEFICESLNPAEPPARVASFIDRFSPEGCWGVYARAYRVPGAGPSPTLAGTGALDAGSADAVASGYAAAPELLSDFTEDESFEEVPPPPTIGDGTRLFHWGEVPNLFRNHRRGSFVVWRSGNVLAATFATAGSLAVSDRIALDLARRQQAHIENPTPYTEAERDFSEVGLDDPALKLPVHWLGRRFDPGHGLPAARLEVGGRLAPALPKQKLELRYSRNLTLDSWSKAGWKRFLATPYSRRLLAWKCTDPTQLALPDGRATIFAAYRLNFEVCPDRPPDLYFAFAHIGGTVTAVNFGPWAIGPYNSLKGMKAIVRGLTLRPKPVYPAPAQP